MISNSFDILSEDSDDGTRVYKRVSKLTNSPEECFLTFIGDEQSVSETYAGVTGEPVFYYRVDDEIICMQPLFAIGTYYQSTPSFVEMDNGFLIEKNTKVVYVLVN
jgi:hypothetical protein